LPAPTRQVESAGLRRQAKAAGDFDQVRQLLGWFTIRGAFRIS
jgi:hypothetical protein